MLKRNFFLTFVSALAFVNVGLAAYVSSESSGSECDRIEHDWRSLQRANKKFIENPIYAQQRAATARKQNPTYVVLSCADSRTPPEIIFNQGLGRIFCPRVAGNTAGDQVVDSIAYAVSHWDVTTVVVLGHERCGAVIGALERLRENGGKVDQPNGIFNAVLIPIERAIVKAGIDIYAPDALDQSIKANVAYTALRLIKKSTIIADAVKNGQIAIVGAIYCLKSGKAKQLFIIDKCDQQ